MSSWSPRSVVLALAVCLVVGIAADAAGLPPALRAPFAVVGLLGAPGAAWVNILFPTAAAISAPVRLALAATVSSAILALLGVGLNAAGIPLTGVSLAVGALTVTAAGVPFMRRNSWTDPLPELASAALMAAPVIEPQAPAPADGEPAEAVAGARAGGRRHPVPAELVSVVGAACFIAAVWGGASWMHLVNTGPYVELAYAGKLQQLTGPVPVAARQTVDVPVMLTTSSGGRWQGRLSVTVDSKPSGSEAVSVESGTTVPLQVRAPGRAGFHNVQVMARGDASQSPVSLTLNLRVVPRNG